VLFEMIAGRPPFKGDTPLAVAIKHVQEQPPSPRALGANVAESLEAITLKLLAKNPDNRYPSAEDLRADLRRYREGMHSLRRAPAVAVAAGGTAPTQVVGVTRVDANTGMQPAPTTVLPGTHQTGYYEPPPENRVGMIIAVTMLLLLSIAGLVFAFVKVLNNDDTPAVANVEVPNVIDKNQGDAIRQLREAGFPEPQLLQETRDDKSAGTVFAQNPKAGEVVRPSTVVVLSVSTGAGSAFPPNVIGLNAEEAAKALRDRGFVPQPVSQASAEVQEGFVISQDPPADRQVKKGEPVIIRVSTGGAPVDLPDVRNQPIDQVLTNFTNLKLKVNQVREASETVEADRVIRTEPQGPIKVKEGQTITVFVSDGLPRVEVPNVVDLTEDAAKQELTSRGLIAEVVTQNVGEGDTRAGKVISQSVPAGQQLRKGQTVRITVGKAPPPTTTTASTTTRSTTTTRN
jgi:serine/threonine-protein kinase